MRNCCNPFKKKDHGSNSVNQLRRINQEFVKKYPILLNDLQGKFIYGTCRTALSVNQDGIVSQSKSLDTDSLESGNSKVKVENAEDPCVEELKDTTNQKNEKIAAICEILGLNCDNLKLKSSINYKKVIQKKSNRNHNQSVI